MISSKIDHFHIKAPESISPEPCEGEIWEIKGSASWEKTESYDGNYFIKKHHVNVDSASIILSQNPVGFKSFIADTPHFKGVGPKVAERLWAKFGPETYNILKYQELSKLLEVEGLGESSAQSLITGYKKFSYLKYSTFFTKHEIPVKIQKNIYKFKGVADGSLIERDGVKFDPNPVNMINENPYTLRTFGMAFHQNDRIARRHFYVKDDDPRRLTAAIVECLTANGRQGHTIALHKQLITPLRDLFHQNESLVTKALSQAYDKRAFIIYPDSDVYQFTPTYIMENVVAKRLLKLNNQSEIYNEAVDVSRLMLSCIRCAALPLRATALI